MDRTGRAGLRCRAVLQRGATEEEQAKYSKRSVRVTKQQNEDCKRLLRLLGVPIIDVRAHPAAGGRAPSWPEQAAHHSWTLLCIA